MRYVNYNAIKGPGDLPGESSHPNSPDYVEPAFGLDDAANAVAAQLVDSDEVAELVDEVANAAGLLDWIAHNVEIPHGLRPQFRALDRHAKRMDRMRDAEYAALNGVAA